MFLIARSIRIRIAALTAATLLLLSFAPARAETPGDGVLRLHVIANSDSPADQAVKLAVRDAVLAAMEAGDSAAEAEAYVMDNGAALLAAAEQTLSENGFSYGARLELGTFEFPDRSYGGSLYPAGPYRALRVVLGAGAGQNWWCVLFPPLCIITDQEAEPTDDGRLHIEFKSFFAELFRSWRAE